MAKPFRARKVLEGRPLRSFCVARCYLTLFVMPPSAGASWSFIWTVAAKFFIPQYLEKLHVLRIPVKHVDHALDGRVPFKPEHLSVYMRFVDFWIDTLSMLEVKFGIYRGTAFSARLLNLLKACYHSAYSVYSCCMTTTVRPPSDSRGIRALRRADPHYFCVPSLHIAIVVSTIAFYRRLFAEEDFTDAEREAWLCELKEEGLAIARSVLYLKQHSVNCIPAALYMVCRIAPGLFTAADAHAFIDEFLAPAQDITAEDKAEIVLYSSALFDRLLRDGEGEADWTLALKRWLSAYEPEVG